MTTPRKTAAKKAPAKRAAKKAAPPKPTTSVPKEHESLLGDITTVPIDSIKLFEGNARIGDLGAVVESLLGHGQFRPLLVQKSTMSIIAGNHTWQGMKHLGWGTCDVTILDVDDDEALRINLHDNRTSDKADYDWEALGEQLEIIRETASERTGWTKEEVDILLKEREEMLDSIAKPGDEALPVPDVDSVEDLPTGGDNVYKLDVNVIFSVENEWGIPALDIDMVLPEIPQPLTTWVGPVISERDNLPGQHFVYAYSTDSTKGIPWHRTLMCFYIHDQRFENWWSDTEKYIERMRVVDLQALITPDYSRFVDIPQALNLWNVYRSAWIGKFAQQAGIKVIPNLSFDHFKSPWSLAHIPVGSPTVAVQLQTNVKNDLKWTRWLQDTMRWAIDTTQPKQLLVYSGRVGVELVENLGLNCEVVYVPNRSQLKDAWKEERDSVYTPGVDDE